AHHELARWNQQPRKIRAIASAHGSSQSDRHFYRDRCSMLPSLRLLRAKRPAFIDLYPRVVGGKTARAKNGQNESGDRVMFHGVGHVYATAGPEAERLAPRESGR